MRLVLTPHDQINFHRIENLYVCLWDSSAFALEERMVMVQLCLIPIFIHHYLDIPFLLICFHKLGAQTFASFSQTPCDRYNYSSFEGSVLFLFLGGGGVHENCLVASYTYGGQSITSFSFSSNNIRNQPWSWSWTRACNFQPLVC